MRKKRRWKIPNICFSHEAFIYCVIRAKSSKKPPELWMESDGEMLEWSKTTSSEEVAGQSRKRTFISFKFSHIKFSLFLFHFHGLSFSFCLALNSELTCKKEWKTIALSIQWFWFHLLFFPLGWHSSVLRRSPPNNMKTLQLMFYAREFESTSTRFLSFKIIKCWLHSVSISVSNF